MVILDQSSIVCTPPNQYIHCPLTPFQDQNHQKPDVSTLHMFGCNTYTHSPNPTKHKSKMIACMYVGPSNKYGGKVYCLIKKNNDKVLYSKNVVFNKSKERWETLDNNEETVNIEAEH